MARQSSDTALKKSKSPSGEMGYIPYPAYKDSGIGWLGEIPAHWEVNQANQKLKIAKKQIDPHEVSDIQVMHYSIPNVQQFGKGIIESGTSIDSGKILINHTLLLVSKLNPRMGTVVLAEPDPNIVTLASSEFVALEPKHCTGEFARYLYMAEHVRLELSSRVKSATKSHQRCSPEDISKLKLPWPPIPEQREITAFLDRKTAKIDMLVEKQEQLINLLQERRAALISHAVTKGLNPNIPLKDSGIEWLGEIPEHWRVKRLKYSATINDETLPETTNLDFVMSYVDISGVDMHQGIVSSAEMTFEDAPSRARRIVRDGDTIVSTVRTYLGAITPIRNPVSNTIVSTGFAVIRPRKIFSDFMSYLLRESSLVGEIVSRSLGVSYPAVNASEIGTLPILLPDLDEQRDIATFLDRETAKIDSLIAKIHQAINLQKELRSALISAAVAGKIDVQQVSVFTA